MSVVSSPCATVRQCATRTLSLGRAYLIDARALTTSEPPTSPHRTGVIGRIPKQLTEAPRNLNLLEPAIASPWTEAHFACLSLYIRLVPSVHSVNQRRNCYHVLHVHGQLTTAPEREPQRPSQQPVHQLIVDPSECLKCDKDRIRCTSRARKATSRETTTQSGREHTTDVEGPPGTAVFERSQEACLRRSVSFERQPFSAKAPSGFQTSVVLFSATKRR